MLRQYPRANACVQVRPWAFVCGGVWHCPPPCRYYAALDNAHGVGGIRVRDHKGHAPIMCASHFGGAIFSGAAFACWVAGPMCDSHRASSDPNSYSFCTCGNPQCRHYAVSGQATVLRVAAESVWSIAACAPPRPCARVVSALCAFSAFSGGLRVYLLRAHLRASEALCL